MSDIALYKVSDMQIMAEAVAKSGLFGMKTPEQALALMLVAQSENQHPASIAQDYDIIQNKACRKTHSVMARFQKMGGKIEWHELTETLADATFSHPAGGSLRIKWTIEQARKAGLTAKDNWKNYPRAMLRARVIAEGVRAIYPAAIGGMMVAEEAQDIIERDMGPADRVPDEIIEPKLPPCPDAKLDSWLAKVRDGKANADELLPFAQAKHTLNSGQIERINKFLSEIKDTVPVDADFVKDMEGAEQQ